MRVQGEVARGHTQSSVRYSPPPPSIVLIRSMARAALTPTLKLSLNPSMGKYTRRWHRASISLDTPVDSVPDEVGNPVQAEVIRGHQRSSEAVPRHKATRGLTRGAISMPISMQSACNQHAISVPRHRATRFGMLSGPNHGASGTRTEAD